MINDKDEQFENPDVDPGFKGHQDDKELTGREDEREHDIDSNISIKEMREGKKEGGATEDAEADEQPKDDTENDALNYKNDREHGAFNPKNI